MGEGTQEQTQGEGINLLSKRLAGRVGGCGVQTSLITRKWRRGAGAGSYSPHPQTADTDNPVRLPRGAPLRGPGWVSLGGLQGGRDKCQAAFCPTLMGEEEPRRGPAL